MHSNVVELERTFKASLYGLAMAAGLILGLAEGAFLPYGTLVLALAGYWLTESPRPLALGATVSNLAGFVAVGLAGREFFGDNPEGRLLAGTHLVVFATWIVFFQQSSVRKYWSICALSVLQVAVASVLTNDSWYGGALIAFAVASMWTLAVFSLYQAVCQLEMAPAGVPAARNAVLRFEQSASTAGHAIQFDHLARCITSRFVGGVAMLACLALMMSAAFYILTPRVWLGQPWTPLDDKSDGKAEPFRQNQTGFTMQVKLGDLGYLLESVEPVMSIQAYDVRSGEDRRLSADELASALGYDEPLFRGGTMTGYQDGSWQADLFSDSQERLPRTPARTEIRQEITLEPIAGDILFCFGTATACEVGIDRKNATDNHLTGILRFARWSLESRTKVQYRLYALVPPRYDDGLPRVMTRMSQLRLQETARTAYLARCRELPEGTLVRLVSLARDLERQETETRGRKPTVAEMSRRLESYLRDSGEYGYTVKLSVQDKNIDPVEDFLFNRKSGHCEYFASTLALMLRAVGIPSRLVNGFKGGETNYRGTIEVQQRHAHAWVEAWEGDDRWLVLDPTPGAARTESVQDAAQGNVMGMNLASYVSMFWTDWVMNFTPERQWDELYEPLKEFGQKLFVQTREMVALGPMALASLWKFLINPREWFSLRGLTLALAGTVVYLGYRQFARRLKHYLRWTRHGRRAAHAERTVVPFYERFVSVMRQRGMDRTEEQTPAEFARTVAASFQVVPELSELPCWITGLFYRVRFGQRELSAAEVIEVNVALDRLTQADRTH